MNCVNHPEAAVSAFCQNCGKGLCTQCMRDVQGSVYCEPCLAERVAGRPGPGVGPGAGAGAGVGGFPPPGVPNPGTATILGFIPGVGAMYNGQYIKAIVHVLVFVVLISISEHYGLFGIFVAAWVLYQVFDAHQTAKARRDGLPLPDPFGLNELGNAFGGHTRPYTPPAPGAGTPGTAGQPGAGATAAPGTGPGVGTTGAAGVAPGSPQYADWAEQVRLQAHEFGRQSAEWGEQLRQRIVAEAHGHPYNPQPFNPTGGVGGPGSWSAPPAQGFVQGGYAPGYAPPPGSVPGPGYVPPPGAPAGWTPPPIPPDMELERARREPIGAIVLILLGMLFLFNTLGFFNFGWVSHGWPLIIVGVAVWLLLRNTSGRFGFAPRVGPPVGGAMPGAQPGANPQAQTGGNPPEPPAGGGQ